MRFWVLDTETTGLDPNVDKIVEVGGVLIDDGEIVARYESLVNPGIPIPAEASAVHHIVDAHVVGAPSIEAAIQPILEEEVDYLVAHNAGFDRRFLDLGSYEWLCTWKLAHVVWPEAPSYGNQVLRYYLGLEVPASTSHVHRALYDAETTTAIFKAIVDKATTSDPWPKMLEITNSPILLRKVSFGEHFGKLWSEVPVSYLKWMVKKSEGWDEDKLHTAKYWLARKS